MQNRMPTDPNEMPSPALVVELISTMPYEFETCYDVPAGTPTGDLWCEFLGIWLRLEDQSYSGDNARGRVYPNWWWRFRIRRALRMRGLV